MLLLTSRSREILKTLYESSGPVRIKELASRFQVSQRSIKYDLEQIRFFLQEFNISLHSQPNKGIWVGDDPSLRNRLRDLLGKYDEKNIFLNQDDRVKRITLELLLQEEYISMHHLSEKIGVSRNTLSSDLKKVELFLRTWNLTLERKVRLGIKVLGFEMQKRLVLESIIQDSIHGDEMLHLAKGVLQKNEPSPVWTVMKQIRLSAEDLKLLYQAMIRIVEESGKKLGFSFSDHVLIGVLIRLSIVVQRLRHNHELNLELMASEEARQIRQSEFYQMMKVQIQHLADRLQLVIPESEVMYVSLHFVSRSLSLTEKQGTKAETLNVFRITQRLIARTGELLGVSFADDSELTQDLFSHLSDKLVKYDFGILDPNPLTADIIRSYRDTFTSVKQASLEILGGYNVFLRDSDLAYLVLHFQAAYERRTELNRYKVLIVCATGRGTARLLKTYLENEIQNLQVVGYCSVMDVEKVLQQEEVDLVVSVLPIDIDFPVVIVKALPTKQDIVSVIQALEKLQGRKGQLLRAKKEDQDVIRTLRANINPHDLPYAKALSQEVIARGYEISQLIISEFKDYLTEQSAAGLTLHILLMMNRLAFDSPYTDYHQQDGWLSDHSRWIKTRLKEIMTDRNISLTDSELQAMLNYFN